MSEFVERLLCVPRLFTTLSAARKFTSTVPVPDNTSGQDQFAMRSAMDIDPRIGKWVSKRSIQVSESTAWNIADINSSRFVDPDEIEVAANQVQEHGFYVFKKTVDSSIVQSILSFAEQVPCQARGFESRPYPYPRSAPVAGRYDIEETAALECPEVQEFCSDPGMALVAQKYLSQPVLMDEVAFWWTTTQRSEMANLNAQLFHQDRDRLSFLKFFIYLTDVTPESGPHVYLKHSHRDIPPRLRGDGRKDDASVTALGLWDNVTEITGPAGSLMAVDTIGLHKGKTPLTGDRLALEIEFSTSLFGAAYERPAFTPTELMKSRFADMPWVLQRYASSLK